MEEVNPRSLDEPDTESSSSSSSDQKAAESRIASDAEKVQEASTSSGAEIQEDECHFDKLDDDTVVNVLQRLDFRDYCQCPKVCSRWNWITKQYNVITVMDLKLRKISPTDVERLVTRHRTLKLYDLTLREIEGRHYASLKKLLRNAPNLKSLNLLAGTFSHIERRFPDCIQFDIRYVPSGLVHLSLRGCSVNLKNFLGEDPQTLLPHLRCLDLGFAYMDASCDSIQTFNKLHALHSLYLEGCYHLAHSNSKSLVESGWYEILHITNLKVLDLEGIVLTGETISFFIESCMFLEELYVGQSAVKDQVFGNVPRKDHLIRTICVINTKTTLEAVGTFLSQSCHTKEVIVHHNWEDEEMLVDSIPNMQLKKWTFLYNDTDCCQHFSHHRCI